MIDDIDNNVKKALANLTEARRAFLDKLEISDSGPPPAPASEEDVAHLEQVVGRRLPPSYRAFLLLQNGFPELDGETNVLAINEMISHISGKAAELLDDIAKMSEQDSIRSCIVFGRSDQSPSAFLFDPEQQDDKGEWKVIVFDEEEGIDAIHESFLAFLVKSTEEAREAEQETLEGQDLLDIDF